MTDRFCPACQEAPGYCRCQPASDSRVTPAVTTRQAADQRKRRPSDTGDTSDTGSGRRVAWTAAELLSTDFPPPRWAVPGIVAEGLNLFAGSPKVGKSWLSLGLGVATATGGKALGRIDVDQGEALYLALEDTPRRLKSRLERITAGHPHPLLSALTIATECPPLPSGGDQRIADWLDRHRDARLVVIDVLSKVRGTPGRDVPQYDADYAAIAQAKKLADTYAVPIIVVHHTRKMAATDFLDEVSGTQGITGAADSTIVLKRMRGQADGILYLTGRDVEEAEYALAFHADLGSWELLDTPVAEVKLGDTRRAILGYVRDHEGARPKEIADGTDLDAATVRQTARRMADDGQLDTDGQGRYFPVTPVTGVTSAGQGPSSSDTPVSPGVTHADVVPLFHDQDGDPA